MFEDIGSPEPLAAVPRWFQRVERAVAFFTAAILALLMFITVVDVVGRYFMNRPLSGAAEWAELAMGLMIFGGIFQAATRSEHIRIDLLDKIWSATALGYLMGFARVASAVLLAFVGFRLWRKGQEMAEFGDLSAYHGVPFAPIAYVMAGACALAALAYVLQLPGADTHAGAADRVDALDAEGIAK